MWLLQDQMDGVGKERERKARDIKVRKISQGSERKETTLDFFFFLFFLLPFVTFTII